MGPAEVQITNFHFVLALFHSRIYGRCPQPWTLHHVLFHSQMYGRCSSALVTATSAHGKRSPLCRAEMMKPRMSATGDPKKRKHSSAFEADLTVKFAEPEYAIRLSQTNALPCMRPYRPDPLQRTTSAPARCKDLSRGPCCGACGGFASKLSLSTTMTSSKLPRA